MSMMQHVDDFSWRTSTYSQANGECVEIAPTAAMDTLIRDSKDCEVGVIRADASAWSSLIAGLKHA
jgi:hypothetical protein